MGSDTYYASCQEYSSEDDYSGEDGFNMAPYMETIVNYMAANDSRGGEEGMLDTSWREVRAAGRGAAAWGAGGADGSGEGEGAALVC